MADNIDVKTGNSHVRKSPSAVMLVGTSHVAEESLMMVSEAVNKFNPDVIAIELDKGRVDSLNSSKKASFWEVARHAGLFAGLFYSIGRILQERIGDSLGIKPGSDMIHAMNIAKSNNIPIALIDRDIRITLARLKRIPTREKWRFFFDIITGRMADKKMKKIDLRKVPADELVDMVLGIMKDRYPAFYSILVDERNHVMASNVKRLSKHYDRILVVVGKGHAPGLKEIFKKSSSTPS
ncbi:MAG: TraB/GumN family protein [Candidatus Woesearchaeota archaeon]